jgi:hypothetical protein
MNKPDLTAEYTLLFEELTQAAALMPRLRLFYNRLNRIFIECLDLNIVRTRLNFGGTFAKTDYLLKEHHAGPELTHRVNETRIHLRARLQYEEAELEAWARQDLRHLCLFVGLVYGVPVPEELEQFYPAEEEDIEEARKEEAETLLGDSLRVIVETWDETYVTATSEASTDGESVRICYARGNRIYDYDWSYLKPLFYAGAQLNLVRPRLEEGVIYPELIIFEPDYLIDISTVAQCFTNYAESPWVHLLKKLDSVQSTQAIVLGNLAGQLLDEQINKQNETPTYEESVKKFWQRNSLSMLTTEIDGTFHTNAKGQKRHIAHALEEVLPQTVSSFDARECMVEPSFFSEMLGLQGRMDFLQLDYKILLEQKSGKGEFPYDNFRRPRRREEHYVQMLLYMMLIRYNFRSEYEANQKELHAFLLYSQYEESLLGLGFAPELIFRAIKVRNELARAEMLYASDGGIRILDTLTAEKMNRKQACNKLWTNYQAPQIEATLAPIHAATELERAYYYRFLTFISNEHLLSKIGNKTKANSGFASKWYDSLEDKLQAGNIYDRLTLLSPNADTRGNVDRVRLKFAETESNNMSNFRVGDIVILYPYHEGEEPDVRRGMVFRCTIEDIEAEAIELVLRATQSDSRVFLRYSDRLWAIEHDFIEASYGALYRGMHAFLSAPKERRDLILLQRTPEVDETRTINGEYGSFNALMTRVKQARDLFLIIGPPGTGKTSYGMLNTLREELTEPGSTVLILSYTNRAVDEICSKLVKERIDFIRLGGQVSCGDDYRDKLLSHRAQLCRNQTQLRELIASARVVVGTTTAMDSNLSLLQLKQFTLAIIDEASQILEPHLMGVLSARYNGESAVRRFVLIGDHKQLPAVVQQTPDVSAVHDDLLNNEALLTDCRLSLFERLLKRYHDDPQVVYMLSKQGRMHQDIALFPNQAFYNGRLEVVPLDHQTRSLPACGTSDNGIDNLLQTRRIAFLHAVGPELPLSDKVNPVEAEMIAATVLRIYRLEQERFDPLETVGVIVPYRNQIAAVRNLLDRTHIPELHDITIDTVERYQGSQRRYIIYGFTVQQHYQLSFLTNNVFEDWDGSRIDRKLNVAMTRAEEHLILVGNARLLSTDPIFFRLIEFVKGRSGYFEVPPEEYVRGEFVVPEFVGE